MTNTNSVPKEDVVTTEPSGREPKHISAFLAEAVKEMAEANLVFGGVAMTTTYEHLIPCPSWCTYAEGHPYESIGEDGEHIRYHSPDQGDLSRLGPFWLSCEERMLPGARDSKVELDELMVCVEPHLVGKDGRMTIAEARLTARAFTVAADLAAAALGATA